MKSILRSRVRLIFLCLTVSCVALPLAWWQRHSAPPARPRASASVPPSNYGQVPLSLEANHGQANEPVKYLARGTNATLYLTPTEAALEVRHTPEQTATVKMKLLGANANPLMQGAGAIAGQEQLLCRQGYRAVEDEYSDLSKGEV